MSTRIEVTKLAQIGDALVEDVKLIEITLASALVGSSVQDLDAALEEVRGLASEASDDAEAAAVSAAEALSHKNDAADSANAAGGSASDAAVSEANAAASEDSAEQDRILAEAAALIAQQNGGGLAPNLSLRDAIRAANRRTYAGSGFAEWGKHAVDRNNGSIDYINQGLSAAGSTGVAYVNKLWLGNPRWTSQTTGDSRTEDAITIVDGTELTMYAGDTTYGNCPINLPTAPDGTKALNSTTGEVHKYHDLAGVGEEYEAHTVDFDGSTYIDLADSPYYMAVGSTVEFKFKWDGGSDGSNRYLLSDNVLGYTIHAAIISDGTFNFSGMPDVTLNGEPITARTATPEANVEYHFEGTLDTAATFERIGDWSGVNTETWSGQIWDIKLSAIEEGVAPITYNTVTTQPKADEAPVVPAVDAGDNPDMPTGYMPTYQGDGYVDIPEFPLADNMNISMAMRPDDVTGSMVFGEWEVASRLSFYHLPADQLRLDIGNRVFSFDEVIVGRVYFIGIQVVRVGTTSDYVVTANVNQQTQTLTCTFASDSFRTFGLGGVGDGSFDTQRWDGDIFGFEIEYPDMPDLNRTYGSVDAIDPSGRLTVQDDVGFGAEDWAPLWTYTDSTDINIPIWDAVDENNRVSFMIHQSVSNDVVVLGQDIHDAGASACYIGFTSSRLFWSGFSDVYVNGVSIPTSNSTAFSEGTIYHVEATLSDGEAITGIGAYATWTSEPTTKIWGVRLTDNTNPANSRHYPLVVNQPTQPTTLIVEDVLGDGSTDGTLENFTAGSEWNNDLPSTDGTMVGFAAPWAYETGRYVGNVIGSTTQAVWDVQDSQKAFHEVKYNTDFHVITSRKDLVFLEAWLEKVEGFVRPYGNVQFGGSSHDGVTLVPVTNFKEQGYSAFGEWDVETVGQVADWDAMTPAERAVWGSNTANGLYFNPEDGEYYQDSYRIRTVEGLGDDWYGVRPRQSPIDYMQVHPLSTGFITPRASLDTVKDYGSTSNGIYGGETSSWGSDLFDESDVSIFKGASSSGGAFYGGACSAMPIALVQRLNQGAYHPTWNVQGCAAFAYVDGGVATGRVRWYDSRTNQPTSEGGCFNYISLSAPGSDDATYVADWAGAIANAWTGRSDQYEFYDAIYAGQVEDLRLNANKQDKQELLTDAVRRGVRGETRGKGKVPFTTVTTQNRGTFSGNVVNADISRSVNPMVGDTVFIFDGTDYVKRTITSVNDEAVNPVDDITIYFDAISGTRTDGDRLIHERELSAEYDSLAWVDIIGDPVRISATFPDGVVGQWIPELPTGSNTFTLNRKRFGSASLLQIHTSNDGVSWTAVTTAYNATPNTIGDNGAIGRVSLIVYEALSDFTESDDNRAVQGDLGDVWSGMSYNVNEGNRLSPSLVEVIGKNGNNNRQSYSSITNYELNASGELAPSSYSNETIHNPIVIANPANNSGAVKALPHLVEKDGLLYVQWHGTQLAWDSTTPVEITMATAMNANPVGTRVILIGGALNGMYVVTGIFSTGTFQTFYDIGHIMFNREGDIVDRTGAVFLKRQNAEAGDWGDDSEITIVNGEATKGDFNGNIVKVVTHTELIPVGIANNNESL